MIRNVGEVVYLNQGLGDDEGYRPAGTPVTVTKVGPFEAGKNMRWRGRAFILLEPADFIAEADGPFGFALRDEHVRSTAISDQGRAGESNG